MNNKVKAYAFVAVYGVALFIVALCAGEGAGEVFKKLYLKED